LVILAIADHHFGDNNDPSNLPERPMDMTSYLLPEKTGPDPFTAEDICDQLGISHAHRGEVSAFVAMICDLQRAKVQTYAVTVTPRFDEEITWPGGRRPVEIGPDYERDGRIFRDCRYEPSAERIATARAAVIRKCWNGGSFALKDAIAQGGAVRAAREESRSALHASLAIAAANMSGAA
jgi:hypothetical protein